MNVLERFIRSTSFYKKEMCEKDKDIIAVCKENEKWSSLCSELKKEIKEMQA